MKTKKVQLIEAALKCFAKKGFHATSIQDIIEEAGSAKGSLYAYFESKEDLLIKSLEYVYDIVMEQFRTITRDEEAPRQRLESLVRLNFEIYVEHADFVMTLMNEPALQLNKELKTFLYKASKVIFQIYHEPVSELYGPSIKPYIGDVLITLQSLIHQFTRMLSWDSYPLRVEQIAEFVTDRLDDIACSMIASQKPALFDEALSKEVYFADNLPDNYAAWADEVAALRDSLQNADSGIQSREELITYLSVLEKELRRSPPDTVLMDTIVSRVISLGHEDAVRLLKRIQKGWSPFL